MLALLLGTGLRIGEALGLRRKDMHFLHDSQHLGCQIARAHDYAEPPARQLVRTDRAAWLADRLDLQWRTNEWDPGSLLFTADLDNPRTRAFAWRVMACDTLVESPESRCEACRAVSARRGHPADFGTTHTPALPAVRQPNGGPACNRAAHSSLSGTSPQRCGLRSSSAFSAVPRRTARSCPR
ncbi:hypothetical protein ACFYW1_35755 [Streptomyces sp. NPDC002669]|uniref:hypothetical protein n=1 Tax=Streptomyces sp. NPDC002669 TaxID=3364658 RepID=UPI0036BEE80E